MFGVWRYSNAHAAAPKWILGACSSRLTTGSVVKPCKSSRVTGGVLGSSLFNTAIRYFWFRYPFQTAFSLSERTRAARDGWLRRVLMRRTGLKSAPA